jgi:hypothetical protein
MTGNDKFGRNNVGMLRLGKQPGNVSQACRIMACNATASRSSTRTAP